MKLLLSPLAPASRPQPLQKLLGCLILALSVSAHFFALGSKADLSLLAYDESQSWQSPVATVPVTASEVLFATDSRWEAPSTRTLGLTASTAFSLPAAPATAPSLGSPLPLAASQFEDSLLALNFHY